MDWLQHFLPNLGSRGGGPPGPARVQRRPGRRPAGSQIHDGGAGQKDPLTDGFMKQQATNTKKIQETMMRYYLRLLIVF